MTPKSILSNLHRLLQLWTSNHWYLPQVVPELEVLLGGVGVADVVVVAVVVISYYRNCGVCFLPKAARISRKRNKSELGQ